MQGIHSTPEVNDVELSKQIIKLKKWCSSQCYSLHPNVLTPNSGVKQENSKKQQLLNMI